MTEYEILFNSLQQSFGAGKSETVLEKFKEVVTENHLECTPNCLHDFLRLTELSFNPKLDKYYGKH